MIGAIVLVVVLGGFGYIVYDRYTASCLKCKKLCFCSSVTDVTPSGSNAAKMSMTCRRFECKKCNLKMLDYGSFGNAKILPATGN